MKKYICSVFLLLAVFSVEAVQITGTIQHVEEIQRYDALRTPPDLEGTKPAYYPRLDCIITLDNGDCYTLNYRVGPYFSLKEADDVLKSLRVNVGDLITIPHAPYKRWGGHPLYAGNIHGKPGRAMVTGPINPAFMELAGQHVNLIGSTIVPAGTTEVSDNLWKAEYWADKFKNFDPERLKFPTKQDEEGRAEKLFYVGPYVKFETGSTYLLFKDRHSQKISIPVGVFNY